MAGPREIGLPIIAGPQMLFIASPAYVGKEVFMSKGINGSADVEGQALEHLPDEISIIWFAENVLEVDDSLTYEQACLVLQRLEAEHDCNEGITWEVIAYTIADLRHWGEL